jgi:hypothetical protein
MKTPLVYIRNGEKSSRIWREAQKPDLNAIGAAQSRS